MQINKAAAKIRGNTSVNDKKNKLIKTFICVLNAVFMMLIFFVLTNYRVLRHSTVRELYEVAADSAVIVENADGSEDIFFGSPDGVYINKLLFDIENNAGRPAKIKASIGCITDESNTVSYEMEDVNPVYVKTEALNIDRENVKSIHITEAAGISDCSSGDKNTQAGQISFKMSGFRIDNRLSISGYVLFFAALLGAALAALIQFRAVLAFKPEYAFLIICLTMGFSMCADLPRSKVSYDEETHMQGVFAIASLPSGELHFNDAALNQVLITEYNNPEAQPGSSEEMTELSERLSEECDYKNGANTPTFHVMPSRAPAYAAMAAGIKAAKLLNAGWAELILVMRISNLLMYALLMFFAIRLTPVGKWLMLLIALFPENIFMASACSYDPFIIGCLSLGYALMLKGKRYILPMLFFFILGCMPKAVYAPVILMGVAVSISVSAEKKQTDSSTAKKSSRIKKYLPAVILCAVVFVIFMAVFILPTVISPEDTGDIRGGEVSALLQVKFILSHPVGYAAILLSQMLRWIRQCWFGPDCISFMGHIVSGSDSFKGFYQPYLVLLAGGIILSHAMKRKRMALTASQRGIMLFFAAAASVLIWTAMYVAFTVPGATEIAGVQGRYFIPLFFPVYLALSGTAFEPGDAEKPLASDDEHRSIGVRAGLLETGAPLCYYLWELSELLLLAATVWVTVISRFCK